MLIIKARRKFERDERMPPDRKKPSCLNKGFLVNDTEEMFDDIAESYDFLNRIISLGLDGIWRRLASETLELYGKGRLLDAAAGTAEQLRACCSGNSGFQTAVGIDVSCGMLRVALRKIQWVKKENSIELVKASAIDMPFSDNAFHAVIISFGIRNISDRLRFLKEAFRTLKNNGRLTVLELSIPEKRLLKIPYLLYCRYIMPLIGGFVTGNYRAYRYLNRSIESFPEPDLFIENMKEAGFAGVLKYPLTWGAAHIYTGIKKSEGKR